MKTVKDGNDGKPIMRAFTDEAIDVSKQFGNNPEDVYPVGDTSAELPPINAGTSGMESTAGIEEEPKPDLKKQLDDIIGNKETDAKDKKTAEELKARLEELETATKNAEEFIAEKLKAITEAGEEGTSGTAV